MAYFELSKEGFDDLIKAAGSRAGQVAAVCNAKGVFEATPDEEAAEVAEPDVTPEVADEVDAEAEEEMTEEPEMLREDVTDD